MAITKLNSLAIPAGTVEPADISYPLTNFSSTGIDDNADATAITISSSEYVGIGTGTDPIVPLDVVAKTGAHAITMRARSNNDYAFFSMRSNDGTEDLGDIAIQRTAADTGRMLFYTNNGTNATVKMSVLPSGGITFNGDTAAANALDDYEEGTWTPQLSDLGGNLATLSTAEGSYTKIGRMVFLHYRVTMSSKGSMTGNYIHLKNIPYNHPTEGYNGTGMVDYFNGLESNVSSLAWDTSSTGGVFWLTGVTATQGTAQSYIGTSYLGGNETLKGSIIYQTSV